VNEELSFGPLYHVVYLWDVPHQRWDLISLRCVDPTPRHHVSRTATTLENGQEVTRIVLDDPDEHPWVKYPTIPPWNPLEIPPSPLSSQPPQSASSGEESPVADEDKPSSTIVPDDLAVSMKRELTIRVIQYLDHCNNYQVKPNRDCAKRRIRREPIFGLEPDDYPEYDGIEREVLDEQFRAHGAE
jgi:hypothetical protein